MSKEDMKQIVLDYISLNGGVTFVEIERLFEGNQFSYKGNLAQSTKDNPNVIFWAGWNDEALDIIIDLEREGCVKKEATTRTIYLIDGKCLTHPVVKSSRTYKTMHWCPVVFNAVEK
jgi:hypothetical protein